jgi:hypothetical protein
MASYVYTRSLDTNYNFYDTDQINPNDLTLIRTILNLLPGIAVRIEATGTVLSIITDIELTAGDKLTLDEIVLTYKTSYYDRLLSVAKNNKIDDIINKNKNVLEPTGFEFPPTSEQYFSLDEYSRDTWVAMFVAFQAGALTFPQVIRNTANDTYELVDSTALQGFFYYGTVRQAYVFNTSAALILSVKACETVEAVLAIVDDRV